MIAQFRVRDKRLQDVITDGSFLHISEVGQMCDEIGVCAEVGRVKASLTVVFMPCGQQVIVKELSDGSCVEVVL